jgi:hypothetical protein
MKIALPRFSARRLQGDAKEEMLKFLEGSAIIQDGMFLECPKIWSFAAAEFPG